jgi:hypothetical protein
MLDVQRFVCDETGCTEVIELDDEKAYSAFLVLCANHSGNGSVSVGCYPEQFAD